MPTPGRREARERCHAAWSIIACVIQLLERAVDEGSSLARTRAARRSAKLPINKGYRSFLISIKEAPVDHAKLRGGSLDFDVGLAGFWRFAGRIPASER